MKPFDLEKALAGEPVVTRDGRKILQIAYFPTAIDAHRVVAMIEDCEATMDFDDNGHYFGDDESICDLFMAPKKRTYYANVYGAKNDPIVFVSRTYITLESAKDNIKEDLNEGCSFVQTKYIKTISFEVEDV